METGKQKICKACNKVDCKKNGGWNYRWLRFVEGDEVTFRVHEVFYDHKGVPKSWSVEPIWAQGDTPIELYEDLILMQKAWHLPVLTPIPDTKTGAKLVEVDINRATGKLS